METINRIIEHVEFYSKNRSVHSISREDRKEIIKLHDELIPMDIKLFKQGAEDCGSCISKAISRFVIHYDTLIQYREDRKPKVESVPTQPKKKRGRPRKRK